MNTLPDARPTSSRRGSCSAADCPSCEVRHLTFCAALADGEVDRLSKIATRARLAPEEMLFQEGDPPDYVFNVISGTIKLYKLLPDGRRQITGFLHPGDFLGLASSGGYSYGAEAATEAELCRFPRPRLEALFERYPGMEKRLFKFANDELAAAQDQMLLLGRKTAIEKIASFFLNLAEKAKKRNLSGDTVSLQMNRSDIADYLGLTIETVSRTMTRLKHEGVVDLPSPREVRLLRRERLEELAEG